MSTAPMTSAKEQIISVEEYHRMIDTGLLPEGGQFELLNGEMVENTAKHPPHVIANRKADLALSAILPGDWHVRIQDPVTLDDSEPEPDVAIVRGQLEEYSARHPGPSDVCLVVEVADTSLSRDREKASIYARNGIPIYWIVNITGRTIEVYSDARPLEDVPSYVRNDVYGGSDAVPLNIEGSAPLSVPVSDLLP